MSLERNQLFLYKIETTSGTDAVPTPELNAVECGSIEWTIDPESLQRVELNRYLDDPEVRLGRKLVNFVVKVSMRGSGTAGTPARYAALYKSCGMKETVTADTSVVYSVSSAEADHLTGTAYIYDADRLVKIVGCLGNVSVSETAGNEGLITFNMQGKFASQADATMPNTYVFDTTLAPIVQSANVTFGAWSGAVVRSLGYASGNKVAVRKDFNASDGVLGMFIGGRNVTFSASIEAPKEATKPILANMLNEVKEKISSTVGATAGNIIKIEAIKAKTNTVGVQRDNGLNLLALSGQCLKDAGDDNLVITYT